MTASIRKIKNDTELNRILNKEFTCVVRSTGFVEVGEDNFCIPALYEKYQEHLRKFEVRDDDIFVVSPPKTGTTWCQEMVWLIANNLNYKGLSRTCHFAFLYSSPIYVDHNVRPTPLWSGPNPWHVIENFPSPRCLKTHFHWSMLPEQIRNGSKKPKIITVLRNPHDTFVSVYHHSRLLDGYKGTFEDLAELFLAGRIPFGPYLKTVLSIWEQRHRPNLLFLKFTELKNDLPGVIRKVANFLEKPMTDEQVEKMVKHLSFDEMKKNPAVNKKRLVESAEKFGLNTAGSDFIRKGIEGGYKAEMSPELIERFNKWERESLAGTGLTFN